MPWRGAEGQNIEHPHTLVSSSSFCFFVKYMLILLTRRDSGELRCSATALICCRVYVVFSKEHRLIKVVEHALNH